MISFLKKYKKPAVAFILFAGAWLIEFGFSFTGKAYVYLPLYGLSYLIVGGPIVVRAIKAVPKGTIFGEFMLMSIATIGAFALGKYAEGVAVMLFYTIGEELQHGAVHRARHSIKKLLDEQPDRATVERDGATEQVHPSKVEIGEVIRVKPGEKVPLDGELITEEAAFNTAALTGESKPMNRKAGEEIWAGSINQDSPVRIRVTQGYKDTKLANILSMVREASKRKAPTQRFISKFANVYTPAVVWLAVAITFGPWLFVNHYIFQDWLYRALIFLVVACPCGLVISIPLGYFGGIGAASKHGILLKGSDFLDQLRKLDTLYFDKTGTLTKGTFSVQKVTSLNGIEESELLRLAASLERQSTHPIGKAILSQAGGADLEEVDSQQEVSGKGLTGRIAGRQVAVGNERLMNQLAVAIPENGTFDHPHTYIHVSVDEEYAGYITISDELKEDSREAVRQLRKRNINEMAMLSGDKQEVVDDIADELGLDTAFGELLPEDKYNRLEKVLGSNKTVGYVGDGVNDAPVITRADVGLAMGGIGSDASIETADVVIQTDQLSRIPTSIDIAHFTHKIVWQNITFALGIKVLVMVLAALGMATMWEAVFADVGVALIAVANAIRIQQKSYS